MRAADLCQQMLAYAGKGRFHEQRLDLGALITDMLPLLKLSVAKGVSLRVDVGPGLPAMYGDPTQMRQVVLNLVTNASDAIAGTGTIEIRAVRRRLGRRSCSASWSRRSSRTAGRTTWCSRSATAGAA